MQNLGINVEAEPSEDTRSGARVSQKLPHTREGEVKGWPCQVLAERQTVSGSAIWYRLEKQHPENIRPDGVRYPEDMSTCMINFMSAGPQGA